VRAIFLVCLQKIGFLTVVVVSGSKEVLFFLHAIGAAAQDSFFGFPFPSIISFSPNR
jgi:hypothetical protein